MGKDPIEVRKLKGFRSRSQDKTNVADWQQISAELLVRAIATVSASGGALRFGYSRDGGAYALGIYSDGERTTEFTPSAEEMEAILHDLIEWIADRDHIRTNPEAAQKRAK